MPKTKNQTTAKSEASSKGNQSKFSEKVRACAFKKLMSALKNKFSQSVPISERLKLSPAQNEMIEFLGTILSKLPPVAMRKAKLSESCEFNKSDLVYATFPNLFGFYSYNQEFQRRVMGDPLITAPLNLLLKHFDGFNTKYQSEYEQIFESISVQSAKYLGDFNEESRLEELKASLQLHQSQSEFLSTTVLKERIFERFLEVHSFDSMSIVQLRKHFEQGNLYELFALLVRRIGNPLTVPKLNQCFELYVLLLEVKHMKLGGEQSKQQEEGHMKVEEEPSTPEFGESENQEPAYIPEKKSKKVSQIPMSMQLDPHYQAQLLQAQLNPVHLSNMKKASRTHRPLVCTDSNCPQNQFNAMSSAWMYQTSQRKNSIQTSQIPSTFNIEERRDSIFSVSNFLADRGYMGESTPSTNAPMNEENFNLDEEEMLRWIQAEKNTNQQQEQGGIHPDMDSFFFGM